MDNVTDPLAPKFTGERVGFAKHPGPLLDVYENDDSLIPEIPPPLAPYKNWEDQDEDNTEILETRKKQLEKWIVNISSRSDELKQHKEKLLNGRKTITTQTEKDIYDKSILIVIKGIYKEDVMMGGIYDAYPKFAKKKI